VTFGSGYLSLQKMMIASVLSQHSHYTYFQLTLTLTLPSLSLSLSLSLSTLQPSYLHAMVSNGDALRCLSACAENLSESKNCASTCLPAHDATTISCADKCFKKQASSIVKAGDEAIANEV
jgi:hypothetical protein